MSSIDPVVVVVHGAWTKPQAFHKLVTALNKAGFTDVHVPELPSTSGARPAPGFTDDVQCLRKTINQLVNIEKKAVILLMHSYGGAVGTEAAKGLTRPALQQIESQSSPLRGVVAMIYLAGYMLDEGWSVMRVVETAGFVDIIPQYIDIDEDGTSFYKDVTTMLYHDLEPADQEEQVRLAVPWNFNACHGVVSQATWKEVPTWYVRTTQDMGVPPAYQDIMLRQAETNMSGGGDGAAAAAAVVDVNVETWECGHSVYVSRPEMCVEIVQMALQKVASEK